MFASYNDSRQLGINLNQLIKKSAEIPLYLNNWENTENPQSRDMFIASEVHSKPMRHMLGMVGGNEVSVIKGNIVDLESDLHGITRTNTFAPWRAYQPPTKNVIHRSTPKGQVVIDTTLRHLSPMQAWAYPTIYAPEPIMQQVCESPEKY
jgi:hypothetical protein